MVLSDGKFFKNVEVNIKIKKNIESEKNIQSKSLEKLEMFV